MRQLPSHWPEYLIEAVCLGLFMLSAAACTTLLQHPSSPLSHWTATPVVQRIPMGLAMGITAIGIIYSPLGRRSGAHMNPAVTLAFYRLGKIAGSDAAAYVVAQFVGGIAGILAGEAALGGLPAHPSVNHIATVPGPAGAGVAFLFEGAISFGLMFTVLTVSNHARLAHFTGLCAGLLVAAYIVVEAPFSGMSMNPARTFGPALLAHTARTLWIYFIAPPIGMLAAAELFVRLRGREFVRCAKLHHAFDVRCIFHCGYAVAEGD
jgi:aquaporin Z